MLQGRGKPVVLHVRRGMSPNSPTRRKGGQAAPRGAARHRAPCAGCSPAPLSCSGTAGRERTLRRGTGCGSPAARPGCSLETLFLLSSGLKSSSSSTSVFHLKTSTDKVFSGRVRYEMKHLPPSTATVRRRERAGNLEGILGRRERRGRKDAFSKKPLGVCQYN